MMNEQVWCLRTYWTPSLMKRGLRGWNGNLWSRNTCVTWETCSLQKIMWIISSRHSQWCRLIIRIISYGCLVPPAVRIGWLLNKLSESTNLRKKCSLKVEWILTKFLRYLPMLPCWLHRNLSRSVLRAVFQQRWQNIWWVERLCLLRMLAKFINMYRMVLLLIWWSLVILMLIVRSCAIYWVIQRKLNK